MLALLWLLTMSSALSLAGTTYLNGYMSNIQLWNNDKLVVNGGGSDRVIAWDSSSVEIYSTSLPLSLEGKRGVYDIILNDNSTLFFSGGATQYLQVGGNATALLTGGTINFLTIGRYGNMTSSVTIDCKKDWEWLYTAGKISGITGTWHNGNDFTIVFQNPSSPLFETWKSVHVIPEPATMLLLGLGGLAIRRRTL